MSHAALYATSTAVRFVELGELFSGRVQPPSRRR